MEIILRHATLADLPAILDIVNHAIAHTTANYSYEPQTLEMQRQWLLDKQRNGFPVIVAEVDREILGYGAYGTFREKIGYQYTVEHSVYVVDGHNGKGIGGRLMAELIRLARAQNLHVMVGAIDAANAQSIAFHKKFGFTESGTIRQAGFKFGQWLDLLFMQLILK
ncbi:GNAT family N-acetyltransferase [Flavobacterium caeni]|uniref:Phosphinothricin acetyltransferase n=1 Tax=Flavobacterium caeni TaxID=490189 RepID=A0A1G5BPS0_9FLAO|nr:GNAT family N-acetyltransferase [Flavobacterium caeni]SCX92077.1 phosphinothricin acetyltransferase [Flavobacterium caeni]